MGKSLLGGSGMVGLFFFVSIYSLWLAIIVSFAFYTWILQELSLPYMQGAGHAAVVYYCKCPETQQMR